MHIPDSSIGVAFNIIRCAWLAFFSYLFNRPCLGQRLTIGRLTLCAAFNILYKATVGGKTYSFAFNASSLTWQFHLPRASAPRWLTLTFHSILYTSTTGEVSTAQFEIILWFFPVLFRQTAGPWANITLDQLRIKIYRSPETPYFIQRLRQNLISTVLSGEVLRADIFRTTVRFAGVSEHKPKGGDSSGTAEDSDDEDSFTCDDEDGVADEDGEPECVRENGYATGALGASDEDEVRFDVIVRQLHINNREGHIYSFGSIDSQFRRNWSIDSGSLVLVSEECRWVHVSFPFECVAPRNWWTQLFSSFFHFPIDLIRSFNFPISSVNLHVTRLDVIFGSFRLRDAEILKQTFSLIREKSITSGIDWSDVFLDALTQAVAPR